MKKILLLIITSSLFHYFSFGQRDFKAAEKLFQQGNYFNAIELYNKSYSDAKNQEQKPLIAFRLADCFRFTNDYTQAEHWYIKAIQADYPDSKAILYLADAKKALGKYDEAREEYNNYKSKDSSDPKGEDGAKSCELAKKWKDTPTRYLVENITLLNSKNADFSPVYPDNKYNKVYLTSTRLGVTGSAIDESTGENYSDIFETQIDKTALWSKPVPLSPLINTKDNEGLVTVNKKIDMLFFTRWSNSTNSQLWFVTKKGNSWTEAAKLNFCTADFNFASPCISSDGIILLFSSNMPGGQGDNDIWMSKYDKEAKKWGDPTNLGSEINTPGNDNYPFIRDDGNLYFSSTGHLSMGGLDIFKAEKKDEGQWGNITNMKYPVNSPGDDFGIVFEGGKEKGCLSSNREGTKGGVDIWSFVLSPLVYTIDGIVSDCISKEPINGVSIKLIGSDGSSAVTKTDATGYYKFAENTSGGRYINTTTSYLISIVYDPSLRTSKSGEEFLYNDIVAKQTTVGIEKSENFKHDFCLTPKKSGK